MAARHWSWGKKMWCSYAYVYLEELLAISYSNNQKSSMQLYLSIFVLTVKQTFAFHAFYIFFSGEYAIDLLYGSLQVEVKVSKGISEGVSDSSFN